MKEGSNSLKKNNLMKWVRWGYPWLWWSQPQHEGDQVENAVALC